MNGTKIVCWEYNAAIHCCDCAHKDGMDKNGAEDVDGNEPHPIFAVDEYWQEEACDGCGERIVDTL